jgi:hypothetical protein
MKVRIRYDRRVDAWTVEYEGVALRTNADVEEWRHLLVSQLEEKWRGSRAFLLVDLSSFSVEAQVSAEYRAVAKHVMDEYALGVVLYGTPGARTMAQIRLTSIMNRFGRVYPNRAGAIRVLSRMREPDSAAR